MTDLEIREQSRLVWDIPLETVLLVLKNIAGDARQGGT